MTIINLDAARARPSLGTSDSGGAHGRHAPADYWPLPPLVSPDGVGRGRLTDVQRRYGLEQAAAAAGLARALDGRADFVPLCTPTFAPGPDGGRVLHGCAQHGPTCGHPGKRALVCWGPRTMLPPDDLQALPPLPRDPRHVDRLFRRGRCFGANGGILTGARGGGLVVVEVDPRHAVGGGEGAIALDTPAAARRAIGHELGLAVPPPTYTVRSGGGGWHLYYRIPPELLLPSPDTRIPWLEFKAEGRLIVAAGSLHASGERYTGAEGVPTALAPLPEDLRTWITDLAQSRARRFTPSTDRARAGDGAVGPGDADEQEDPLPEERARRVGARALENALARVGRGTGRHIAGRDLAWRLRQAWVGRDLAATVLAAYAARVPQPPDKSPYSQGEAAEAVGTAYGKPVTAPHWSRRDHAAGDSGASDGGMGDSNWGRRAHRGRADLAEAPGRDPNPQDDDPAAQACGERAILDAPGGGGMPPPNDGDWDGDEDDAFGDVGSPGTERGRPLVKVNDTPLREKVRKTLDALREANAPPRLFVRGGALARVRRDERGRPLVDTLTTEALQDHMSRAADFVRERSDGTSTDVDPPPSLARVLLARGNWPGFPALVGLTEVPVLRDDGTVLDTPGYDVPSRLIYAPARGLHMPELPSKPTRDQVRAAVEYVGEQVLYDFPFVGEADRAHAWALLLSPIVRPAIAGHVPLTLVDAPAAGTGKGLLVDVAAAVATGRRAEVMTPPDGSDGGTEWRKRITSVLRNAPVVALLDNVERPLRSPELASMLTADTWQDRELGRSQMLILPQRAVWMATGNNLRLGGDLPRRCVWLRMDAKMARPYERRPDAFRNDPLLTWVHEHRGEVLAALLTIARGWFVEGRPAANELRPLGSFEERASIVGGILAYAAIPGFLGNLTVLHDRTDEDTPQWEAWLTAWRTAFGERAVSVAEVGQKLDEEQKQEIEPCRSPLLEALPERLAEAYDRNRSSFGHRLGRALAQHEGTRYTDEGLRFVRAESMDRKGGVLWRVESGNEAE